MKSKPLIRSNVFNALMSTPSDKKIVINRGGTRSGKTYSISQQIVIWLLTGKWNDSITKLEGTCDVVRKTMPALRASAMKDFTNILEQTGLAHLVHHIKRDNIFQFEGREVRFYQTDDEHKLRGNQRDFLFINEADKLTYEEEFFQLLIRTRVQIVLDFNPSDPYTWIKTKLEDDRALRMGDVRTVVSTYLDNPCLPPSLIREIEAITDPDLKKVYRYGQYGTVKGLVFPKIQLVSRLPDGLKKVAIGLDFGFTNDPTAAVICGQLGDVLFFRCIIYDRALTNQDIAERLLPYGLPVIADSAEPKSIEELRRLGIRVRPAVKGPDSIRQGIALLKRYELAVTGDSEPIIMEQKLYKYADDLNTKAKRLNPVDKNNHAWDAIRYWAQHYLSRRSDGGGIIT